MAEPTNEMLDSIIESTDGTEGVVNLAPVRFGISMSSLSKFKDELEMLIERHRI